MKTDLFRFATLRTPQLISQSKKRIGYLEHPKVSDSFFLKSIAAIKDLDRARKKIRDIHTNFKPSRSVASIKKIDEQLYKFSSWLMLNKNTLTIQEVMDNKNQVKPLALPKKVFLWDNLLYQIIAKESEYVRQACIQMLVASNFIELTKAENEIRKMAETITTPRLPTSPEGDRQVELFLRRLANVKLIIPSAFTAKKQLGDAGKYQPKRDYNEVESTFDRSYLVHKAKYLEHAKSALQSHNKSYRKEYGAALNKARREHDKVVETINKEHLDKLKPRTRASRAGETEQPKPIARLDPNERLYLKYPDFKFDFAKPLSDGYVKDKLDVKTLDVVDKLQLRDKSIEGAVGSIDREIKSLRKKAFGKNRKPQKIVVSNGNVIKGKKTELYCYSIGLKSSERYKALQNKMYMSINVGYVRAFIVSSTFKIKIGAKTYTSKEVNILENTARTIFFEIFPGKKIDFGTTQFFDISGELELNNGIDLRFSSKGFAKNKYTNGCAHRMRDEVIEENDIHFGINRIGIADYRKVEQEVCCYVPGEVSHIENILAREYKERHTRNFTSTESTTELTSEVEIENLTDTSTTERNELNTETANVLNEDRSNNFGFSAGVSGSYAGVTISADGYADFANSTASSESNSIAKTYAEDVTLRALERVVQKISEKRTSTILKEFEENNRHGFDNRNGDKHVTGIYRWVDKIYTNRLVNYGKRLMYEFLIPEPARFYRSAITTVLESDEEIADTTKVIEVPQSPEELGFSEPGDIDESNYQGFAAAYNISIEPPLKETDDIAHSVTVMPKPNGDPFNHSINDLMVPDGYEAIEAAANMTFVYDRAFIGGPNARFVMTLGGKTFSKSYGNRDRTTKNLNHNFEFGNAIKTKVSGSISGDKIVTAGADVVLTIRRTNAAYEAWQNMAYDALMNAYNLKIEEYNAEQEAAGLNETSETEAPKSNPRFNRIIEQREIKRICIEMLTRPFGIKVGGNFYDTITTCGVDNPTEIHRVKQTRRFDRYASHVKFFEQAFDWEIMSYLFYPYYWAAKCKWVELFQSKDTADPIFQSFLQSGMARIVLPVRVGFEEAVAYFMETGEIWNGGGLVIDSESDLYLSIVEEMQEIEGVVEEEWKTTVPTSLTIVQNQSAQLDEGGLPCCDEVEGAETIKTSDVTIGIPEPVVVDEN